MRHPGIPVPSAVGSGYSGAVYTADSIVQHGHQGRLLDGGRRECDLDDAAWFCAHRRQAGGGVGIAIRLEFPGADAGEKFRSVHLDLCDGRELCDLQPCGFAGYHCLGQDRFRLTIRSGLPGLQRDLDHGAHGCRTIAAAEVLSRLQSAA